MSKLPDVKIPLLKTDGTFADPVQHIKKGITWKFTLIPVMPDNGKLPSIDLKIEVIDFGGHCSCFLAGMVMNTVQFTRFDATFHANKSTFMFRDFSKAVSKKPNGLFKFDVFPILRNIRNQFDLLQVFMEKADDGTVKVRASDELLSHAKFETNIANTFLFGIEMHMCMTMPTLPAGVIDISWCNPTFSKTHLGQTLEINLEWFEGVCPNIKELLDEIPKMSKSEFIDLQNVLGLYYHEYATSKLIDGRILRIVRLAEQMGFKKLYITDGWFDKLGKVTVVEEGGALDASECSASEFSASDEPSTSSGKSLHFEMCKINSDTQFKFKESFDAVPLHLSIFSSKFNNQPYLSLGVVTFPSSDALYHVTIKISCDLFQGEVSRYISATQNTMTIPTLYRCSEELDKEVQLKIEVEYERVAKLERMEPSEMPGVNDIALKFGEKKLGINKDYLLEHFAYFRSYASFEKGVTDEIELKTFEYLDVLHVLEVLCHRTVVLTESEFRQCSITADALVCDAVIRICETSRN